MVYAFLAQLVATRSARGLSSGEWREPTFRALLLFLLLVGFTALGRFVKGPEALPTARRPLSVTGFVPRPGAWGEFGAGAALGWGLLLLSVLPSVFIGGLHVTFWTAAHQWRLLLIDLVVLLLAAAGDECIFRGFPFQRLIAAIGPTLATLLMSAIFAAAAYDPYAPRPAVFTTFLLGCILSIAYLRTRALWLPIGLHFLWNAATGILLGLPVSGNYRFSPVVQSDAYGPLALTGGDFGPAGSAVALLVALWGLWLVVRVTREYAYRYAAPEIIPGGIPVDIDAVARRQHEAVMGVVAPASPPPLVQIESLPPAGAPPAAAPIEPSAGGEWRREERTGN